METNLGSVAFKHVALDDVFVSIPNGAGYYHNGTLLCGRYSAPGKLVKTERVKLSLLYPMQDVVLSLAYINGSF